jgi:hypothetical protein
VYILDCHNNSIQFNSIQFIIYVPIIIIIIIINVNITLLTNVIGLCHDDGETEQNASVV